MNIEINNKLKQFSEVFLATLIYSILLFSRPFIGVKIFTLRLGELIVGFLFLFSIYLFLTTKKFQKDFFISNELFILQKLLVASFFVSSFLSQSNFLNPYTFKSSSNVWLLGSFFLFYGIFKHLDLIYLNSKYLLIILLLVYIFTTIYYPNILREFFYSYSDKFDYHKAGDIFLIYFLTTITLYKEKKFKKFIFYFFTINGLFLPLFIYMSRGTTISTVVLITFILFRNVKEIRKNLNLTIFGIIIFSSLFAFSSVNIASDVFFKFLNSDNQENVQVQSEEVTLFVADNIKKVAGQKNYSGLLSFYFQDGMLFSNEILANWRLQLWQAIYQDMKEEKIIIFGYGYKEPIPRMTLVENNGMDGTNENVHNYFFQNFSRGGLIQLVIFLSIFISIIKIDKKILYYLFPIIFIALFDTSMESVRYPLIFYIFLAFFIKNKNLFTLPSKL